MLAPGEFDRIRTALEEADPDEPLTASEIAAIVEERTDLEIGNAHRVATVLGRRARTGEVEVIREDPYRYRI